MKILVIKDAPIAGSVWEKGTILEAPAKAAKDAIAAGIATDGDALDKAIKTRADAIAKRVAASKGKAADKPPAK
jgi:hypothetical protein